MKSVLEHLFSRTMKGKTKMKLKNVLLKFALCAMVALSSCAALADVPMPPNDYTGFRYRRGYYEKGIPAKDFMKDLIEPFTYVASAPWTDSNFWYGTILISSVIGLLPILGIELVWFICQKVRKHKIQRPRWVRVIAWSYGVVSFIWTVGMGAETRHMLMSVVSSYSTSWPDLPYYDNDATRNEYDRHCLECYTTNGIQDVEHIYMLSRGIPKPRPDAPENVKQAYSEFWRQVELIKREREGRRGGTDESSVDLF